MSKTLKEKLADCKSLQKITDPLEIQKRLVKRKEKDATVNLVLCEEKGNIESFRKVSGGADLVTKFNETTLKEVAANRNIPWEEEYKDRFIPSWGSDERVDSDGDIVLQNWDYSQFKNNPAMPFNHDWGGLPVGVHVDWKVRTRADSDYAGDALWLLSLHATKEQSPFADFVFRLRKAQFLRANSVGFYPQTIILVNDQDERNELGLGPWGDLLDNNLLFENSPTLLGANPGALNILNSAASENLITASDCNSLREINRRLRHSDPDLWKKEDEKYANIFKTIFPELKTEVHADADKPFEIQSVESETLSKFFFPEVIKDSKEPLKPQDKASDLEAIVNKNADSIADLHKKVIQLSASVETLAVTIMSRFDNIEELLISADVSDNDELMLINGTTINNSLEDPSKESSNSNKNNSTSFFDTLADKELEV